MSEPQTGGASSRPQPGRRRTPEELAAREAERRRIVCALFAQGPVYGIAGERLRLRQQVVVDLDADAHSSTMRIVDRARRERCPY